MDKELSRYSLCAAWLNMNLMALFRERPFDIYLGGGGRKTGEKKCVLFC